MFFFYNHNPVLSSFMNYHRMPYNCKTTGATSGAATAYPEFTFSFCGVRVAQSLVFYVVFYVPLFVLFHLGIILSVQRFSSSDYPFDIFNLFLYNKDNNAIFQNTYLQVANYQYSLSRSSMTKASVRQMKKKIKIEFNYHLILV
jgi:hypothetical protein